MRGASGSGSERQRAPSSVPRSGENFVPLRPASGSTVDRVYGQRDPACGARRGGRRRHAAGGAAAGVARKGFTVFRFHDAHATHNAPPTSHRDIPEKTRGSDSISPPRHPRNHRKGFTLQRFHQRSSLVLSHAVVPSRAKCPPPSLCTRCPRALCDIIHARRSGSCPGTMPSPPATPSRLVACLRIPGLRRRRSAACDRSPLWSLLR